MLHRIFEPGRIPQVSESHAAHPLAMIALLGLVHGFGLSTQLQELPLNQNYVFYTLDGHYLAANFTGK